MGRIVKTVFISYRRTNLPWALNIYQYLTHHGYDVFFDYQSIGSGDFERAIIENIKHRAHFLVVLTPSALKRLNQPGDMLRLEIETAMDEKRNIVPLMLDGFDFDSPKTVKALDGKLKMLKRYNGLKVHDDYFLAAMERLHDRYLNIPVDAVLQPLSESTEKVTEEQKEGANKAEKVKPKELEAQIYSERSYLAYENNNLNEALRLNKKSLDLNPEFASTHYNLGVLLKEKGRVEEAETAYRKAIEIDPGHANAHNNLGNLLRDNNKSKEAEAEFYMAIEINPLLGEAHNNLGYLLEEKGQVEEAESAYRKAIDIDPEIEETHNNLGGLLSNLGRNKEAETVFRNAIKIFPQNASVHSNLGIVLAEKGQVEEAETIYHKAIEINPEIAKVHNNLGSLLANLGRNKEAEVAFLKAIEIDPEDAEIHHNLGLLLVIMEQFEEAEAAFLKVLKLDPDEISAYSDFACLKSLQGENNKAFEWLEKAIEKGVEKAWAWEDPDLELLRKDKRFEEIVGPNPN